jgi:hypothetical protein
MAKKIEAKLRGIRPKENKNCILKQSVRLVYQKNI